MMALAEWLKAPKASSWTLDMEEAGRGTQLKSGANVSRVATAGEVQLTAATPVTVRVDTRYLPAADGGDVAASAAGFVVSRTMEIVRDAGPGDKIAIEKGTRIKVARGTVLEEQVQIVVPEDRTYVVIEVPLAAGVEALNPRLQTSGPEATPRKATTRAPTFADWRDDVVVYYYERLPKGTYDLAFRTRATVVGDFVMPSARAERLYDATVVGWSAGARVVVE
jgi:hypothetical protein